MTDTSQGDKIPIDDEERTERLEDARSSTDVLWASWEGGFEGGTPANLSVVPAPYIDDGAGSHRPHVEIVARAGVVEARFSVPTAEATEWIADVKRAIQVAEDEATWAQLEEDDGDIVPDGLGDPTGVFD